MSVKEIAIISGKGGTGKTSLTASIIPFLENVVIADCDVDAPDLNILFDSTLLKTEDFYGFQRPVIDYDKCIDCGLCYKSCNFNAITEDIKIKDGKCEGCKVCEHVCPVDAISMVDYKIGNVFTRETEYGVMVDARLIPGEESSGKLVTEVRTKAKNKATELEKEVVIIDGSPGIACNVISAVTGVDEVVIVTEPTLSGLHDLKRVVKLIKTFHLDPKVVINKFDIAIDMAEEIKLYCDSMGIEVVLEIPFDEEFVKSISRKQIPSLSDIGYFKKEEWSRFIRYLKG
jgi:MinD superfamily P-loop ATPase